MRRYLELYAVAHAYASNVVFPHALHQKAVDCLYGVHMLGTLAFGLALLGTVALRSAVLQDCRFALLVILELIPTLTTLGDLP